MGASAAAAIVIAKEKHLVFHLRQAGATSPDTARTLSELGVAPRLAWDRLVARAVVREARPGTFYLDEPSWKALRRLRIRLVGVAVVVMLVVILARTLMNR